MPLVPAPRPLISPTAHRCAIRIFYVLLPRPQLEEDFCPAKVWGLGAEPRKYNSVGWFKLPSNGQLK